MISIRALMASVAWILLLSSTATADTYIKSRIQNDPVITEDETQPGSTTISEQWITDGKAATVTGDSIIIIDTEKNLFSIVDHNTKSYIQTSLPLDPAKMLPGRVGIMLLSIKTTVAVAPTGKKKTFGARSCDEYNVALTLSSMPMNMKVYASTDVPFDYQSYMDKIHFNMMRSRMLDIDEASIRELGKIKGFWIAEELTAELMGAKIRQTNEVIEITNKPAPAGIYEIPAGYKKKDNLPQNGFPIF